MTVYLVTRGNYDDYRVAGIFSTREKAESYLNLAQLRELLATAPFAIVLDGLGNHVTSRECDFNDIEAIEVDALTPVQWQFEPPRRGHVRFITPDEDDEDYRGI